MSAPAGNANAPKWTKEKTNRIFDQLEEMGWDEHIHTLSQALLRVKCYKQLWSYWKKKWEHDGDLMDRIYYIEQLYINKLEEGALYRRMHPSACYFILRHCYGYSTKGERELPAHLRTEFEEPVAAAPDQGTHTPASKPSQTTAKTTTTAPRKDFIPQLTDQELATRFGMDVRKNQQMYHSSKMPAVAIR